MAEWLGSGLQNHVQRFESARDLKGKERLSKPLFCFINISGPVVQLNRTSDSGSEGRGFESRRSHKAKGQKKMQQQIIAVAFFFEVYL